MISSEGKAAARREAARLSDMFQQAGASQIEASILQPAAALLDLYGEDIRARAYVTNDPLRGEMMLRPDFTVPVVQMHMASGADPARYCYAGEVFRRQEIDPDRPSEYLQVGYELFGGHTAADADAEVFAMFSGALEGVKVKAVMGDIGILVAAVRGLHTTDARKSALLRHIWRPRRFKALLERFGQSGGEAHHAEILAKRDPLEGIVSIGARKPEEVLSRVWALREDALAQPIPEAQLQIIERIMAVVAPAPEALETLRDIALGFPQIGGAVERLSARLEAMRVRDVVLEDITFETTYGRGAMEYYDGFVFGLYAEGRSDLPALASGGRYDALTRVLGQGRMVPAVGGVIRPETVLQVRESQ